MYRFVDTDGDVFNLYVFPVIVFFSSFPSISFIVVMFAVDAIVVAVVVVGVAVVFIVTFVVEVVIVSVIVAVSVVVGAVVVVVTFVVEVVSVIVSSESIDTKGRWTGLNRDDEDDDKDDDKDDVNGVNFDGNKTVHLIICAFGNFLSSIVNVVFSVFFITSFTPMT